MFARRSIQNPWDGKIEPFRIIGNVYFVGTYQASSHLIDTGDGLILIDSGYAKTLYLVIRSIYKLGFRPEDLRYIVLTHHHWDHVEATRQLVDLSGAKTLIGEKDAEPARGYFDPDILLKDGDTLTLGNTTMRFVETPGHTRGTLSLFFDTQEGDATYRVGMFGGAGMYTLVKERFDYEGCREDYRKSIHRLQEEHVDVFIGNHVWNNDTENKGKLLLETGKNTFIDETLWPTFLDFCEKRLDELIEQDA
ncbi:MAG: MBL fold metallo-hydrolase [Clostridia bacterium]|nr:MBL fold metallo-hydrolase [Clostridia bacterium]